MKGKRLDTPLVSVIIPCYNVEAYVERCLDSIVAQTYRNLEIICVDDASTDGTRALLDRYMARDARVKVLSREHGGVSAARNSGLDAMTGEYMGCVDPDDWIEPNTYELAVAAMTDDVDMVSWNVDVSSDDELFHFNIMARYYRNQEKLYDKDKYILSRSAESKSLLSWFSVAVWHKLYRTSIIKRHKIRFLEGLVSEDHGFWLMYTPMARGIACLKERLYHYWLRKNSIIYHMYGGGPDSGANDKLYVLFHVVEFYIENGLFEEYKDVLSILFLREITGNLVCFDKKLLKLLREKMLKYGLYRDRFGFYELLMNRRYGELLKIHRAYKAQFPIAPLISIIVPAYNAAKYLRRCLDSLLAQTYRNLEIICVDDGSDDSTGEILQEYAAADPRVFVQTNPKNEGAGAARQKGLAAATGGYVMWCDADDWYAPQACAELLAALQDSGAGSATCRACIVNDDPDSAIAHLDHQSWRENFMFSGLREITPDVMAMVSKSLWGKIFRKSVIDKYGIEFPDIGRGEDTFFAFAYYMATENIFFLDRRLYTHVKREDSIIGRCVLSNEGDPTDIIDMLGRIMEFVRSRGFANRYGMCNEIYYRSVASVLSEIRESTSDVSLSLDDTLPLAVSNSAFTSCIMDIFFSADSNYAEPLCVAMTSILASAAQNEGFRFHILDGGIAAKDKAKIEKIKRIKPCEIDYIGIDASAFSKLPAGKGKQGYLSRAAYFRYMLAELASGLDRALYLDCDIVVCSSIRELWNIDLGDDYIAAVEDSGADMRGAMLEIGLKNPFNSGVMLIDCAKWRRDGISAKLFGNTKELLKRGELVYLDQDVLNYTFKDRVRFAPYRFNVQERFSTAVSKLVRPNANAGYEERVYSPGEYRTNYAPTEIDAAYNNPVIVHYAGFRKPWQPYCAHLFWWLWFRFLRLSPYAHNLKKHANKVFGI